MGRLADSAIHALLDAFLGSGHIAPFTSSVEIALSATQPNNDGSGVTEPAVGSYAAAVVPNDTGHWAAAASRQKLNAATITFPTPTGIWGTVEWFAIYDHGAPHSTATFRAWGRLATATYIDATSTAPTFAAGALIVNGPA